MNYTKVKSCSIIFSFLMISNVAFSQLDSTDDYDQSKFKNKLIFSGLSLFNVRNPAFQIGYERRILKDFGIQIRAGVITKRSFLGMVFSSEENEKQLGAFNTFRGHHLRTELRWYLKDIQPNDIYFLSFEIFDMNIITRTSNEFYVQECATFPLVVVPQKEIYEERYQLYQRKKGIHLKFGAVSALGEHISVETYGGLGVSVRETREKGRSNLMDQPVYRGSHLKPGRKVILQIPINLEFNYNF